MSNDSPTAPVIDPSPFSFGIVCARFNEGLTQHLLDRVLDVLRVTWQTCRSCRGACARIP